MLLYLKNGNGGSRMKQVTGIFLCALLMVTLLLGCGAKEYEYEESVIYETSASSVGTDAQPSGDGESDSTTGGQGGSVGTNTATTNKTTKPKLTSNKKVTLTYYVWGNANEFKLIEKIVKDFQSKYSNIKINIERSASDYFQNFILRVGGGNAPDVFFMDVSEYAIFAKQGLLLPLDSYIPKASFSLSDLWEINNLYRFDGNNIGKGKLYALIKDWSPNYMLFYNKDHYDKAGLSYPSAEKPMTWSEFMSVSKKLTIVDSSNKMSRYGTIMDYDAMKHLQEFIIMAGGSVYSSDYKKATLTTPAAKKAIQYFIDLQKGDDAPARYSTESMSLNGGDMFAGGTVSNVFYGLWAVPAYFESSSKLKYGVALPPVPDGATVKGSMAGGIISHAIYSKTKNPNEAFIFLNYLQTEGQVHLANAGFNIPGNKTVAHDVFAKVSDPTRKELHQFFLKCAENYVIKPIANPYISQIKFEQIVSPKLVSVILGRTTLDDALKQAEKELNAEIAGNL